MIGGRKMKILQYVTGEEVKRICKSYMLLPEQAIILS